MNEILLFLQNNHIITPDALDIIKQNPQEILEKISALEEKPFIINKEIIDLLTKEKQVPTKIEEDKLITKAENETSQQKGQGLQKPTANLTIIQSHDLNSQKREVKHFVSYFRARYEALKKILENRGELAKTISIKRIKDKKLNEKVAMIGIVSEKRATKNGHLILQIEDPTEEINVLISKSRREAYEKAKDLTEDEVIGVTGIKGENIVFANDILFPDVPLTKELKKSSEEAYAAFTSDIHVGSKMFLPQELEKFINWLNGEVGTNEQKELAQKVKYLFVIGDLVDGVGIYPGQDKELTIKDIEEQYNECARYLAKIRKDIQIIICGGNHDALRLAEPQPQLSRHFAKKIYGLPNATIVSNPAVVNIHASPSFPGFDILLYHGYSFDYYVATIDSIRNNGGYDRADLIMSFLLQKRHLAPTHCSTLYIPDQEKDPLVITKVPDFFVSGHIHKAKVGTYRNVTTICCSCWQAKTSFQEKVGHNPEPARVPIVNLRTRQVKIMRFGN